MRLISLKSFSLFAAIAVALSLSACGNKTSTIHSGDTEGVYLDVGKLKYQVEISRQLNPQAIPEDKTFTQDIAPADATLAPDELWFAVFVRVENPTGQPLVPTSFFTITDTEGDTFQPVKIGSDNPFFYNAAPIGPHTIAPNPDSVAGQLSAINGMELLFKLKRSTLDNRPLILTIKSFAPDDKATDSLDV
ncbi:MAG: hypothetical protein JWM71_2621 [Solirubrobacteraceae bacterium]|nr:hypothetical protein [Solirubrobacteraceae bacterium]